MTTTGEMLAIDQNLCPGTGVTPGSGSLAQGLALCLRSAGSRSGTAQQRQEWSCLCLRPGHFLIPGYGYNRFLKLNHSLWQTLSNR
jgi:hypothetical protein